MTNRSLPRQPGADKRGLMGNITLIVSWGILTLALVGAGMLVINILFRGGLDGNLNELPVKLIVLGFAFAYGWVIALISIRRFGNYTYTVIIQIYLWVCLIAIVVLYLRVISRLFSQEYDWLHFWAYWVVLLGGIFVLTCLHLLLKNHNLRLFGGILFVLNLFQLYWIIYRYVFMEGAKQEFVVRDFAIFFMMMIISVLMLLHTGILTPLREWLDELFTNNNGQSE